MTYNINMVKYLIVATPTIMVNFRNL